MANIVRFPPPASPASQGLVTPISQTELRALLEDAAQVTLDAVDRILATLDRVGEDRTAEPHPGPPKGHEGQVAQLRGNVPDVARPSPEHSGRPRRGRP